MHRRGTRYVLDVLLLAAAVVVITTGFLVDQLDLNQFTPHRWAGYVAAVLIALHVVVHWRWFLPERWTERRRHGTPPSQPVESAAESVEEEVVSGDDRSQPSRRVALAAAGAGVAGAVVGWSAKSVVSPSPYVGGDVGLFYHRESSLGLRGLLSDVVDWGRRPAPYLSVGDGESVALPALGTRPTMSVAEAMEQRRSLRDYDDRPMTAEELAWVVFAATGITSGEGYRTAPSAGALYPLETYVAVNQVEGVDPGIYHVDVRAQALEPVRSGSVAGDLMVAGLGQDFLRKAPVVLLVTGLFQRTRWKYHERHYRYVCWEGGHVAQNVYLAAEAVGLGACMVGAFFDGMVNDLLRVDGRREAALGLIAVGHR
jgi:SagB-type dehydrogenase family enzyme